MNLGNVKCDFCDNTRSSGFAMARVANKWQCGECIIKLQEKMNKLKQKLLLEE